MFSIVKYFSELQQNDITNLHYSSWSICITYILLSSENITLSSLSSHNLSTAGFRTFKRTVCLSISILNREHDVNSMRPESEVRIIHNSLWTPSAAGPFTLEGVLTCSWFVFHFVHSISYSARDIAMCCRRALEFYDQQLSFSSVEVLRNALIPDKIN